MKYLAQIVFNGVSVGSANTSYTSDQIDVGGYSTAALQYDFSSLTTAADLSFKIQGSLDPMSVPASNSVWKDIGSASAVSPSTNADVEDIREYTALCRQKVRVSLTRSAGSGTAKITFLTREG